MDLVSCVEIAKTKSCVLFEFFVIIMDMLKEKEEVIDFLKNLGIEYRFSCFSEKNNEGKPQCFYSLV